MAKSLLAGKLNKDKVSAQMLTPEQVEAMHQAMTSAATTTPEIKNETAKNTMEETTTITKITPKSKTMAKQAIIEEIENEVITRLSIDVSKEVHKKMKIRCIENEISIRDYVVALIKKDLGV
jgi:hypothetical protein